MSSSNSRKQTVILLALSALLLSACGSGNSTSTSLALTAGTLLRSWRFTGYDGGIQKDQHLRFTSSTLTNTITCHFPDGTTPTAVTTSNIQISGSQFTILNASSNSTPGSMTSCDATLSAGSFTYQIYNATLSVTGSSNGSYGTFSFQAE